MYIAVPHTYSWTHSSCVILGQDTWRVGAGTGAGRKTRTISIAVNHKYLLDGLNAMKTEQVTLLCTFTHTHTHTHSLSLSLSPLAEIRGSNF
jgi:hypothetical protein